MTDDTASPAATPADARTPDDPFWDLVQVLGGTPEPDGVERLVDALAALDEAGIVAFADDLARAASALDTPEHMAQEVRDVSEPQGHGYIPPPMSSDVFLYARLAVVAAGREAWQQVLDDPARMAGTWHLADGETLLYVAEQAWDRVSEYAWDHEPPVDLESGTSPAWGDRGIRARIDAHLAERGIERQDPAEVTAPWLSISMGFGLGVSDDRPAFGMRAHRLVTALAADPAWVAWWEGATAQELELSPFYEGPQDEGMEEWLGVRRGRRVVTVRHTGDGRRLRTDDVDALLAFATDEVRTMLEAARVALKLPPLPPFPDLRPDPHETAVVVRGPRSFVDRILDGAGGDGMPPFQALLDELRARSGGAPTAAAGQLEAFIAQLAASEGADDDEDDEDEDEDDHGDARRRRR